MNPRIFALSALLACSTQSEVDSSTSAFNGPYLGTFDDLPVEDDDVQRLQHMLDAKWSYFLYEMDLYNQVRDSSTNDAMVEKMERVFAPEFEFAAEWADGSNFGDVQGTYTSRSWLEAQDVDSWNAFEGTLLIPNAQHILYVDEPGLQVRLVGYHDHNFVGEDLRLIYGEARQIAFETVTFTKNDGVWRVTDYIEVVFSASELPNRADEEPPGPSGER